MFLFWFTFLQRAFCQLFTSQVYFYEQRKEVCCCRLECLRDFCVKTDFSEQKILFYRFEKTVIQYYYVHENSSFMENFLQNIYEEKVQMFFTFTNNFEQLIPHEKRDYVRGTIKIGHWRGHDCIILIFIFEGFYEDHSRLLSENYYFR